MSATKRKKIPSWTRATGDGDRQASGGWLARWSNELASSARPLRLHTSLSYPSSPLETNTPANHHSTLDTPPSKHTLDLDFGCPWQLHHASKPLRETVSAPLDWLHAWELVSPRPSSTMQGIARPHGMASHVVQSPPHRGKILAAPDAWISPFFSSLACRFGPEAPQR